MLAVGRITKLFGAEGEVNINLYADFPDDFSVEQPLFTMVDSLVVPLFCESFSRRGKGSATVRFADIDTTKRAELIMGNEIFIEEPESDDARGGSPGVPGSSDRQHDGIWSPEQEKYCSCMLRTLP